MIININSDLDIKIISEMLSTKINGGLAVYIIPCYRIEISLIQSKNDEFFLWFRFFDRSIKTFYVKWIFPKKRFIVEAHKFGIKGNGRIGLCSCYLRWPDSFGIFKEYEFIERLLSIVVDNDFIKHMYGLR